MCACACACACVCVRVYVRVYVRARARVRARACACTCVRARASSVDLSGRPRSRLALFRGRRAPSPPPTALRPPPLPRSRARRSPRAILPRSARATSQARRRAAGCRSRTAARASTASSRASCCRRAAPLRVSSSSVFFVTSPVLAGCAVLCVFVVFFAAHQCSRAVCVPLPSCSFSRDSWIGFRGHDVCSRRPLLRALRPFRQGGDFVKGNGSGGESIYAKKFKDEPAGEEERGRNGPAAARRAFLARWRARAPRQRRLRCRAPALCPRASELLDWSVQYAGPGLCSRAGHIHPARVSPAAVAARARDRPRARPVRCVSRDRAGLKRRHDRPGVLSMGNSGKHSNASQFFVTLGPAPQCDGRHVVFGGVVSGLEARPKCRRARAPARSRLSSLDRSRGR